MIRVRIELVYVGYIGQLKHLFATTKILLDLDH